jgi:hypothetical protein
MRYRFPVEHDRCCLGSCEIVKMGRMKYESSRLVKMCSKHVVIKKMGRMGKGVGRLKCRVSR